MGPEGVKVVGFDAPATEVAAAVFDTGAGSCGVDAAPGELMELSFGDERDDDSIGVEFLCAAEAEDVVDMVADFVRAIRGRRSEV